MQFSFLPYMSLRFYTQDSKKTSSQALVLMNDSDLRPGSTSSYSIYSHKQWLWYQEEGGLCQSLHCFQNMKFTLSEKQNITNQLN